MGNNYQRLFYIFQNMDGNLGNPTGYIRVEINSGTAKLQISLNNLANRPEIRYQLYGLNKAGSKFEYTVICDIENSNGRAEQKFNLDSSNIGSNRLCFDDINVFAVIARQSGGADFFSCPLVTYKGGQVQWRQELEAAIRIPEPLVKADTAEENGKESVDAAPPAEIEMKVDTEPPCTIGDECLEREVLQEEPIEELSVPVVFTETSADERLNIEEEPICEPESLEDDSHEKLTSKFEATLTSLYSHEQGNFALNAENDIMSAAEKNFKDISSISAEGDKVKNELDIGLLREELDKSFETCSPFNNRSKRFYWWKINSPGYLNNILFRNNIKTYLLFNPKVMLAHYKYRYIIFGIRYEKYSGRERFVCGIPGVYSIDENPFGSMGSWVQLEGYKPKYGAFGYWIILIDPRTGKLIKIK